MADIIAGVVQPNYDNCGDAPVGAPIEVPVVGPQGPPGPPGPPGASNTKFTFVFTFGDSINPLVWGTKIAIPSPYSGTMTVWRARNAGDLSSSVTFAVSKAPSVTGALTTVGGTQPAIAAAKGAQALSLDWTITSVVTGEVIEVGIVSGDSAGVTLIIECSIV